MRVLNEVVFNQIGATAGTYYGDSIQLDNIIGYSVQAIYTSASPAVDYSITLQASNNGTVFNDIDEATDTITTTGSDTTVFNVHNVFYMYFRVKLVVTTGTISVLAVLGAKGL